MRRVLSRNGSTTLRRLLVTSLSLAGLLGSGIVVGCSSSSNSKGSNECTQQDRDAGARPDKLTFESDGIVRAPEASRIYLVGGKPVESGKREYDEQHRDREEVGPQGFAVECWGGFTAFKFENGQVKLSPDDVTKFRLTIQGDPTGGQEVEVNHKEGFTFKSPASLTVKWSERK